MYIEFIKDHVGQLGKKIPAGNKCHKLNEAAKLLISQGIAKAVEDPENYETYPIETTETTDESSTDENETYTKPRKPRKRALKK